MHCMHWDQLLSIELNLVNDIDSCLDLWKALSSILFSDHLYILFQGSSSITEGVAGKQRRLTGLKRT